METPCSAYFDLAYFFAGVGCVWVLVLAWWCCAVYGVSRQHTRTLHKVILFVVFFKTLFSICYAGMLATCPFTSRTAEYMNLAVSSAFTLFYTFLYTVFLLLSKGYCVTRYMLSRSEVTVVAVVMGVVYLSFSAYTIQPALLFPLLILLILGVFFLTSRYTMLSIAVLRRQISNLQRSGIQDLVQPALRKLRMMQVFAGCLGGYFTVQVVTTMVAFISGVAKGTYEVAIAAAIVEECLESPLLLLLLAAFRPKYHGELSTLPLVDTGNPASLRSIPPLIRASARAENLSDLGSLAPYHPIVILHPVVFQPEDPYLGVEIAQEMRAEERRSQVFPVLFGR